MSTVHRSYPSEQRPVTLRSWRKLGAVTLTVMITGMGGLRAETWTDSSGKFKVEAQFVAVQGDKVVLKKPDGSTIQVPLARLDKTSQDQARRMAAALPAQAAAADQPPDVYLRQLFAASDAGDYQQVWNALPPNYQKDIHELIHTFAKNMDARLWSQGSMLLKKVVRVLQEKREYILAHPQAALAGDALAKILPPLTDVLDAVVNSELSDLNKLKTFDVGKFAQNDGKRIAEKLKAANEAGQELQKLIPRTPGEGLPGAEAGPNPFAELGNVTVNDLKIHVEKREGDTAVLRIDVKDKPGTSQEWVRVSGKWLPKKMVDEWPGKIAEGKKWTERDLKQAVEKSKVQIGFFMAPINHTLDLLLAAQSQEEFNKVISDLQQQFGGAAPGAGNPQDM